MLSGIYGAIVAKKLPPLQVLRLRWNIEFLRLRVVVRQRRRRDEYNLLQGLDAREDLRVVNEYAVIACMFSAQIDKGVGRLGGQNSTIVSGRNPIDFRYRKNDEIYFAAKLQEGASLIRKIYYNIIF